ncbi:maltokinase N-terminal cap-like domain-containing protein [Citricoccus muralis]|uniref:Maltokinase N-terminal cap domain-containing protein n=1 Tax=Citricoccus muralis TaxID=169134 RepID=A0ABY8H2J5_9MICC|nr:hypothetical protein [Citricoccus muralis]WFP15365.1 hypothetical protein P8192_07970 [Citricoccus muralis]
MAIIYNAELHPTKAELLTQWLDRMYWGGSGDLEVLGSYRFDDAEGEVGLEGFIIRRGELTLHVPLTYRGAPLEAADQYLVGEIEHSVLGRRWVYDAMADPVAVHILNRALAGEIPQAELYFYDEAGQFLGSEPNTVSVLVRGDIPEGWGNVAAHHVLNLEDDDAVSTEGRQLVATWGDGSAVIFSLIDA